MRTIETISDMKAIIRTQKEKGNSIGFVPTMGYLHEGHMSLVKASVQDNDFTILSIYVNPTQFGVNEDLAKYPRSLERDYAMAQEAGVDIVFIPSDGEVYPNGYNTFVNVEGLAEIMCGLSRPAHFKGVTTIVTKLFNIIEPNHAYFGQKDAQQAIIIKKIVKDLNMNLKIEVCPIVREKDGLAMSSRNVYLNSEERKAALSLSKSLFETEKNIKAGERSKQKIIELIRKRIKRESIANIDYIEIKNGDTLEDIEDICGRVLIALAVKFGTTRLIDNILLEV
jgi:pantoate--beta-alanine ligase